MTDLQYICSGLLKIHLVSQEATCFYVNEETGLFGILFFFFFANVSPDSVIEAGVPVKQHLNSPIRSQAGAVSLVASALLLLLALSSDPPPCTETGGHLVTAQLNKGVSLDCCPAGAVCRGGLLPGGCGLSQAPLPEHPSPLLGTREDGVQPPVRMTLLRPEMHQHGGDLISSSN